MRGQQGAEGARTTWSRIGAVAVATSEYDTWRGVIVRMRGWCRLHFAREKFAHLRGMHLPLALGAPCHHEICHVGRGFVI